MTHPLASVGEALVNEFTVVPADIDPLVSAAVRLLTAIVLGGALGVERERAGKSAGLRTHMLTALGAALFVVGPRLAGMNDESVSRILQGVVAGIGFLGGGVILKQDEQGRIKGVTTAAGIWLTSAVGICAGLGRFWLAVMCTTIAIVILSYVVRRLEDWISPNGKQNA
jgi:putative Mg2+ transporter-C (MgtC) family protein